MTSLNMSESDATRFKEMVREDAVAATPARRKWNDKFAVMSGEATRLIVQAVGAKPGMQGLDIATGTGEPGIHLAEVVAPDGQVTAIDLVPEMLDIARDAARQRGITNIVFQVADAEEMPFPDEAFDVVVSRFGVMFFPHIMTGLQQVQRVLKPGGRAAFLAWGTVEQNPFHQATVGIFRKYMPPPNPNAPPAPNPQRFAQPGVLSAALEECGFREVKEELVTIRWPWPGAVEEAWGASRDMLASFRRTFDALSPEVQQKADSEVHEAMRQFYDGQQVNFPATLVLTTCTR